MDELLLTPDRRWHGTGLTAAWFREKAEWIQRDSGAPGAIDQFFNSTARLLRLCCYDYMLLGPMFFHAVIGLEAMLRVHYEAGPDGAFRPLLERAVREGVITDRAFSEIQPLPNSFKRKIAPGLLTHAEQMGSLLPTLRNDYFHGFFLLAPELLHLALEVREMADRLTMPRKAM
jgi:hypothetical protein